MPEMKHFILNPKSSWARDAHAIASRAALRKYADWIADVDPELAKGLKAWVNDEAEKALKFYREEKIYHTGQKMRVASIKQDLDRGVECVTFAPVEDKIEED